MPSQKVTWPKVVLENTPQLLTYHNKTLPLLLPKPQTKPHTTYQGSSTSLMYNITVAMMQPWVTANNKHTSMTRHSSFKNIYYHLATPGSPVSFTLGSERHSSCLTLYACRSRGPNNTHLSSPRSRSHRTAPRLVT